MKIIFTLIGTLIGAGFASGQEVYTFFYSYGIKGIIGITISSSLIGIIIYKALKIIKVNQIKNYKELLDYTIKDSKIKDIMNIVVNIFILVSFYVMIAGFGAYLMQEYNINSVFGSSILAVICFIIFKSNIKGFVKINEILIPILIGVVVLLRMFEYRKIKYYRNQ